MSLQSEIANLSTRIAAEFNTIRSEMESVSNPYTSVGVEWSSRATIFTEHFCCLTIADIKQRGPLLEVTQLPQKQQRVREQYLQI